MRKVDLFWTRNDEWWEIKDGVPMLKESAPEKAKESYKHYLEQTSEEQSRRIDCNWEELLPLIF